MCLLQIFLKNNNIPFDMCKPFCVILLQFTLVSIIMTMLLSNFVNMVVGKDGSGFLSHTANPKSNLLFTIKPE